MATKYLFLFLLNISHVIMYMHRKPVAEKVWGEYCAKNSVALNDCNWCFCDKNNRYSCKARVCQDVDMFGHFNDAIEEVDPGMEGHGVWRTSDTACEAGVHYRKNDLLCVCNEDGKWPNPVCRDIFRVLHKVELTPHTHPSENQTCTPLKLHLIGCNVCVCPSSGTIDPKYCTNRHCDTDNDTTMEPVKEIDEIYAACYPDRKYKLGCRDCVCLKNNRLLCDNCTTDYQITSMCSNKNPNIVFQNECNLCYCDEKGTMYCSTKRCIRNVALSISLPNLNYKSVDSPLDAGECKPGTTFKIDCNVCFCFKVNGAKTFRCTLNKCFSRNDLNNDCVVGTSFEENCYRCRCTQENGEKVKFCSVAEGCMDNVKRGLKLLSSMHGYCEPLHTYRKGCNKCKCLADGKTVACSSNICGTRQEKPLVLELIPIVQNQTCPNGYSYKVDCNDCICMKNGDTICTTFECRRSIVLL